MTEPLSHEQLREIQDQIRAGRKIEAIKLFRDATGVGLKEAKDAVEQMEAEGSTTQAAGGGAAPGHDPLPNADRQRVVAALRAGQKIEAIRIYREATGVGLKEAKDAVEAMPGGKQAGGGCLGVLFLCVAITAAAWFVLPRVLHAAEISDDVPRLPVER